MRCCKYKSHIYFKHFIRVYEHWPTLSVHEQLAVMTNRQRYFVWFWLAVNDAEVGTVEFVNCRNLRPLVTVLSASKVKHNILPITF